jgi:hypothetical protein
MYLRVAKSLFSGKRVGYTSHIGSEAPEDQMVTDVHLELATTEFPTTIAEDRSGEMVYY